MFKTGRPIGTGQYGGTNGNNRDWETARPSLNLDLVHKDRY
jgi:hypothetical protein